MTNLRIMSLLTMLVLIVSCSTVSVKYTPQKQPLTAALIIPEQVRGLEKYTTVNTACLYADFRMFSVEVKTPNSSNSKYKGPEVIRNGYIMAHNKFGKDAEELSVKGLSRFFEKVDVYIGWAEVKNREDYDYIIIPEIEVSTHYDEYEAKSRTIKREYYQGKAYWAASGQIDISTTAIYKVHLKNVKDGNTVAIYSGQGSAHSKGNPSIECSSLTVKKGNLDGSRYDPEFLKRDDVGLAVGYASVIGEAMSAAFEDLSRNFESELVALARTKLEEQSLPSDLEVTASFSDNGGFLPNRSLDAGEDAEIFLKIRNTGKGIGFKTKLEIVQDNPELVSAKEIEVGDISAGETKEIRIGLQAGLDLQPGKATVQIALKEKRGYDAKKVVLNIPTAKLDRPQIEVVLTEINDGETGLAKGNGNGIPENGETVELTVFVKNNGEGKAIGVNLTAEKADSGLQWVRDSVHLGTIEPGKIEKAKLAFSIPRNFNEKEITTSLSATDARGVAETEKRVALNYSRRSPSLESICRISSKGSPVKTLVNGEVYEIDLAVNNKGEIPAKDVTISLSTDRAANLSERSLYVGEIKAGAAVSRKVTLTLPRTFAEKQAQLDVMVSQADFQPVKEPMIYSVDLKRPQLAYSATLNGRTGENSLEQGESSVLELQVINDGNLPAHGVKIAVRSKDENLRLLGQAESPLGVIPANSRSETIKIPVSTLRRIKVGDALLDINITQDDFQPLGGQYAINIVEEGAVVVDVEGERRKTARSAAKSQIGPSIALKGIQNEQETSEKSLRMAVEVEDLRTIEKVIVTVNGTVIFSDLPGIKKTAIIKDISLREGENRVVVRAYNADNALSQEKLIVRRLPEEDVDTPAFTGLTTPDAIAVVIGISKYDDSRIPEVDYARRDAEVVKKYLLETLGFKEENVQEFYDEKATSTRIKSFIKSQLRNRIRQGASDVFVFYSGHGVPEDKEAYIAPFDLVPEDVKTSGFAVNELYDQLAALKARSVTVVLDACFSGFSGGEKSLPLIQSASPVFLEVASPMFKIQNGTVLSSSSGKQLSSWYPEKRHGIFTYYFLLGLKGKADIDADGKITAREMEEYLRKNVPEKALSLHSREQMPEVTGAKDRILIKYR